jgi:hypothetical protein
MRTQYSYNSIHKGVSLLMDGGKPYSYDGVLWRPPGIHALGVNNRLDEVYRFGLGNCSIQNRTGVTIVIGIGGRVHPTHWKAGQWTNVGPAFVENTVAAQDAIGSDFDLEGADANDGFMIATRQPVNAICLDIGVASTGAVAVRSAEYSQAGGTWGLMTNLLIPPVSLSDWAVGEALILWQNPTDLAVMEAAHGTGVPVGMYGYRFRSTTQPTTPASANSMSVAEIIMAAEGLTDNTIYNLSPTGEFYINNACDALVVLLSSKAAIQSVVNADVRVV